MEILSDLSRDGQREMGMGRQSRSEGAICTQGGLLAQGRESESRILPLSSSVGNGAPQPVPTASSSHPPASLQPASQCWSYSSLSIPAQEFLCRSNLTCCGGHRPPLNPERQDTGKGP